MSFGKRFNARAGIVSAMALENEEAAQAAAEETTSTAEVVEEAEQVTKAAPEEVVDLGEEEAEQAEVEFEAGEEVAAELDETTAVVDAQADTVDELEAIADTLEAQQEEGGATPATIAVAEIAVEHCVARLVGYMPRRRRLPALESFGGLDSRVRATKLAVESIRDIAEKAWEAIKKLVANAVNFIKQMYDKFLGGFGKMKAQLLKLKEALKKGGVKAKDNTINVSAQLAAKLKLGGKFTKEAFTKGIANVRAFVAKIAKFLGIGAKTIASVDIGKALDAANKASEEATENAFPAIDVSALGAATKAFGSDREEKEEGVVTVKNYEALPGDASAYVTGPDVAVVGDTAYRAITSMDIRIDNASAEAGDDDVVIKAMTEQEVGSVIDDTLALIGDAEGLKSAMDAATATATGVAKDVEAASKVKGESAGFRGAMRKVQSFAQRAANALARPLGVVLSFIRQVVGASIAIISGIVATIGAATMSAGITGMAGGLTVAGKGDGFASNYNKLNDRVRVGADSKK